MNNHAGWSRSGICVSCGSDVAEGRCDPEDLWERLDRTREELLETRERLGEYWSKGFQDALNKIARNLEELNTQGKPIPMQTLVKLTLGTTEDEDEPRH